MLKIYLYFAIYQFLGRYLPDNDGYASKFLLGMGKYIRAFLVRGFTGSTSKNLYINKNAELNVELLQKMITPLR